MTRNVISDELLKAAGCEEEEEEEEEEDERAALFAVGVSVENKPRLTGDLTVGESFAGDCSIVFDLGV